MEGAVCPRCDAILTVCRSLGGHYGNAVGTATVCDVCGQIGYFDSSYRLRLMTPERWKTTDPHERSVLAAMQRTVRLRKKQAPNGDARVVLAVD